MDIESAEKSGYATVRLDSPDEQRVFGTIPINTSPENSRLMNYIGGRVLPPLLLALGFVESSSPEEFPKKVDVSLRSLGKTASRLASRIDTPNSPDVPVTRLVVESIGNYFVVLAAGKIELPELSE